MYLVTGISLAIVTMLLMPVSIFMPTYINNKFEQTIRDQVLITEASSTAEDNSVFRAWQNSTSEGATPSQLHAYFFNITNPEAVLEGAKPHVDEFGPYVYTISKQKAKINFTIDTFGEKIVEYIEWKQYFFEESLSKGKEDDFYTNTNIIFQFWRTLDSSGKELVQRFGTQEWDDQSRMFLTKTVKEWLFGWEEPNFLEPFFPGLIGPQIRSETQVAIPPHAMYTGETRIGNAFQYYQHSGIKGYVPNLVIKTAPMWSSFDASRLVGSDGTRFSPFLDSSNPIHVFVDEAKRSVPLHFVNEATLLGLELYEYRISSKTMESLYTNPDNAQWSMYKAGIFNLTQQKLMPMILTKPHFLDCDDDLRSGIDGLKPDRDIHDTILGVHQITGVVMRAQKSLQPAMNTVGPLAIKQQSTTWFPKMIPNTYQPMVYISERGRITDADAKKLNGKISSIRFAQAFLSFGLLILSIVFLSGTAFLLYKAYQTKVASFTTFSSGAYGDYQYNSVQ